MALSYFEIILRGICDEKVGYLVYVHNETRVCVFKKQKLN